MRKTHGARLLLVAGCLLTLKLTGCPAPTPRRDPTTIGNGIPSGPGTVNATTPATLPEPVPPVSVPARNQCPVESAGRTCYVTQTDDGTAPPAPHPCQYPQVGQCDPAGQPLCLFRWKMDGEPCNNNLGVCQAHRCKCSSDKSCGYDCTQTCDAGTSCQQGQCVADGSGGSGGTGGSGAVRGGCAHSV